MKYLRLLYIPAILYALTAHLLASCSEDDMAFMQENQNNLTLELKLGEHTRTTLVGIDSLRENKIEKIDIFLFGATATENDAAKYSTTLTSGFSTTGTTTTLSLNVPLGKFNQLFPDDATTNCQAYVIVNRPEDCTLPAPEECTLAALKHLTVKSSQFNSTNTITTNGQEKKEPTKQDKFVMDGLANNIARNGLQLSGNIPVKRTAVKVQLLIRTIADHVEDNGKAYSADKNNVRITFKNGCKRSYINETTPTSYLKPDKSSDMFNLVDLSMNKLENTNRTTWYPIYTYPTYWGNDDASRTYIILTIDWFNDNDNTDKRTTYYEIPVNAAGNYLMRNTFYKIIQEVNIIGSENIDEATRLYPSNYVILDWNEVKNDDDGTDTDAEISKLRYLVAEESDIVLNNVQTKEIAYFSSNTVEVRNLTVQKSDVSGNIASIETIYTINGSLKNYYNTETKTYTIPTTDGFQKPLTLKLKEIDGNNYVILTHELVNDMSKTSDYSEYIFTFDLAHTDEITYTERITVTQYPMISIAATQNYDYGNGNNDRGYVMVNKNKNQGGIDNWAGVYGNLPSGNDNNNPNRYIIYVSSLTASAGEKYIIGDPRSKDVSNPKSINTDDKGRKLTYYYPTETSASTKEMISPEFMVASSYGRCTDSSLSKEEATRRCATYQEDGYPAGRWRVPTEAEIKYIVQLSGWGIIPSLFSSNMSYWSAQSAIQVNQQGQVSTTNSDEALVRCVYDTWYWGTEQMPVEDRTTFVYGDKQR